MNNLRRVYMVFRAFRGPRAPVRSKMLAAIAADLQSSKNARCASSRN
jgi:hypothetical protein